MLRLVVLAILCAVTSLGCGDAGRTSPVPVYSVKGKVTYKGEPVAGADITFFNSEEKRSAFGRTDENGEYQLTTFNMNDGAVAGKHIVTIAKFAAPTAAPDVASVETETYVPPQANRSTDPPRPKSEFPEKYGKQETSGLLAVVNPDAPNEFDFDLKE